jgi:hypothetical protein
MRSFEKTDDSLRSNSPFHCSFYSGGWDQGLGRGSVLSWRQVEER